MKIAKTPQEGASPQGHLQITGSLHGEQRPCGQAVRKAGGQATRTRSRWVSGHAGALQSEGRLGTRLHLHDDGFLGDFSLLLSDYKENSRNSEGYRSASAWMLNHLSGMAV